jgi:UDP-glucose 4-epimerase
MKNILVTGGMGFIGSHTCIALIESGFNVIILDNLCNSDISVLARIATISGQSPAFYFADLTHKHTIEAVFKQQEIHGVIHFAALKAVGESVEQPINYYQNNLLGTLNLCQVMQEFGVYHLVFSSSATVYGDKNPIPYKETMPLSATSPYGQSKVMIEQMLQDLHVSEPRWNISLLRYFNPIGAHPSGLLGEDPKGIPNNLMPYIAQVATGQRDTLGVFGDDYDTPDGTGIRDYIHVLDLADGHLKALAKLQQQKAPSIDAYNLGAGKGYSVLDVIKTFEQASLQSIPFQRLPRRAGDIAEFYADASKAKILLNWQVKRDLKQMCEDTWRWQKSIKH